MTSGLSQTGPPAPYGRKAASARTAQGGDGREEGGSLATRSSLPSNHNTFTLPPLRKNARGAWEESIDTVPSEWKDGASPARRARKHGLAANTEEPQRSVVAASLEVDAREKELSLNRENRHATGRLVMELWVNQVLDPGTKDLTGDTEPLQVNVAMLQGLARFGLTRTELAGAGLTNEAIDRVYRCLYVYTIGFFDVMQETFEHSEFRLELLSSVWQAFLFIAESALKVAFKSDYLRVFQAQQLSAAELLVAKEALAEARQDSYNTEKALAWLTAAHAEERALRQQLKSEVENTQGQMVREQRAHQAAVVKFLAEMEARNKLQLECNKLMDRLSDAALAQANLIAQRDTYKSEHDDMESKCNHVLRDVNDSYEALTMDGELSYPEDLQAEIKAAQAKEDRGIGTRLETLKGKSSAVRHMTLAVYELWRKERHNHEETQSILYTTKDALRDSKTEGIEAKAARDAAESAKSGALAEARAAVADCQEFAKELDSTRTALEEMTAAHTAATQEIERLTRHTQGLETVFETVRGERDNLNLTAKRQADEISSLDTQLQDMTARQAQTEWQRSEISKGLSVAMRCLWANQCGRNQLQEHLKKAKAANSSMKNVLDASDRQIRVLDGELERMTGWKNELAVSMDCANVELKRHEDTGLEMEKKIEDQAQQIVNLQRYLQESQREVSELSYNEKRSTKLLEAAERALGFEKEEVARLYASLQELEKQLVQSAEERKRLVHKIDQIQQESFMVQDKYKRREDTLQLEARRLQNEVKTQKARIASLEMSIEQSRKSVEEAKDALVRKRTKKERWKRVALDGTQDSNNLRAYLAVRDKALEALALRLQPLQVDLAILMADRGRKPPKYEIPPGGFKAAIKQQEQQLRQSSRPSSSQPTSAHPTPNTPSSSAPGPTPTTAGGDASGGGGDGGDASQYASPEAKAAASGAPQSETQLTATSEKADASGQRDQQGGTPRNAKPAGPVVPAFGDPPELPQMGINTEELRDISEVQRAWDETNKRALAMQLRLDEGSQAVTAARKAYERSRAIFYTNPTDPNLQAKMEAKEAELASARGARSEVEQELLEITQEMRKHQKVIDDHEAQLGENRLAEVKWRVGTTDLNLRTEHSARLDDAQGRCDKLVKMLQEQRVAYDMLRANCNHLEGECGSTEQELKKLSAKLSKLVGEKMELENSLQTARGKILSLQNKNNDLTAERDQLTGDNADHRFTIKGLHQQLQAASQSVQSTVKRLEKGFADERARLIADAEEEKADLEGRVARLTAEVQELSRNKADLQAQLKSVLLMIHDDLELSPQPRFLYACRPRPVVMGAEAMVPNFSKLSNFSFKDPVVSFIAPNFDLTLVLISHIYMTKIMHDSQADEQLLGGAVGKRAKLEGVVYDFFVQRYGIRPAAEMHLCAFLNAVTRYRQQHPKIRVFSRLLGLEDPLPPVAAEFYTALLNRIHARAGPLVAEAAEGTSQVKCKVIAKACRELLRGSYTVVNEDASNLSDTLRRWAGNDEEQKIDLEVCLEVALKAWYKQHVMDTDALVASLDEAMAGKDITPDDFVDFIRRLDPIREDAYDPALVTRLYRAASRQAGPHPRQYEMMSALSASVLREGFVGMGSFSGRLEAVRTPPPYDEFRILEEAWSSMRTVVEAQMEVLNKDESVRLSLPMYIDLAKRLDQQLDHRNDHQKAWAMYRTLLTIYMSNRVRADKVQPFQPPTTPQRLPVRESSTGVQFGLPSSQGDSSPSRPSTQQTSAPTPKERARRKIARRPSFGAVGLKAGDREAELGIEKSKPSLTHGGGLLAPRTGIFDSNSASPRSPATPLSRQ